MNEIRLQKLVKEKAAGLSDNSSNRGAKDIQVNTLLSLNSDFHDFFISKIKERV